MRGDPHVDDRAGSEVVLLVERKFLAGAEGVVFFDKRCVYQGHAVRNARIVMERGRATEVSAEEGEDFLISMLDQDEGARRK
ncbi:MAG: aminopeptidase [Luteolibacter sp.]